MILIVLLHTITMKNLVDNECIWKIGHIKYADLIFKLRMDKIAVVSILSSESWEERVWYDRLHIWECMTAYIGHEGLKKQKKTQVWVGRSGKGCERGE